MRVLHTSDWHIGRRFKGIDLLDYQRKALEWLVSLIEHERVDVLCVSGDVYDAPRPSAEAVRLFGWVFQRLGLMEVNGHPLQIVFTPGNHDSAARLGFGAALMRPNVHMRCGIEDIATPVLVDSADGGQLAIYALPYLDPDLARPTLQGLLDSQKDRQNGLKIARSHEGVMRAALRLATADLASRRAANPRLNAILMAHAFVSGAASSDSERNITVGGVDSVPAELFSNSGLDYLALGHLHRPQKITIPTKPTTESQFHLDRTPQARYSGSLLAYSFSESQTPPVEGNGKSVVLLDFTDGHLAKPRIMPVESGEPPFVQIKGTMDDVLGPLAEQYRNMWVSITVQVPELPHGAYQKIDRAYTHALEKNFDYSQRTQSQERRKMVDLKQATDEMDVLRDFVKFSLGRTPTDKEERVLRDAMETVRKNAGKEVAQ
ncbi:exonuclease subunit SbcD [Bifidobacterium ruminantium]|uniref:exonuclease SbcCD subunit D n=1 Tax=Bifidobacterium ruminantium TaxID=78346 RepID=UPI00195EB286|nr:exonuclease SbcCD subunit D [Bifidobacterium ruminantium]MBM6747494.1 exonuclease subunit SbcD [Bifidobacterium ruminantium]